VDHICTNGFSAFSRNAPLFTVLYKVALTLESADKILKGDPIHRRATEQYFPVVLFITLYKVVLKHLFRMSGSHFINGFSVFSRNLPLRRCLYTMLYKVVLTFESADEIL